MSYLQRTGNNRNDVSYTNTVSNSIKYLTRTGNDRNNVSFNTISSTGKVLERTGSGRNDVRWNNISVKAWNQGDIDLRPYFPTNFNMMYMYIYFEGRGGDSCAVHFPNITFGNSYQTVYFNDNFTRNRDSNHTYGIMLGTYDDFTPSKSEREALIGKYVYIYELEDGKNELYFKLRIESYELDDDSFSLLYYYGTFVYSYTGLLLQVPCLCIRNS